MNISFTYSPLWLLPIAALALGIAYFLYRRTGDQLPRIPKFLLAFFRFLSIVGLGIMLIEPLVSTLSKLKFPPIVVVLQDISESMTLHKDSAYVRTTFRNELKAALGAIPETDYKVEGYRFDTQLRPKLSPDSLYFTGNGTNIGSAIQEIQNIYQNQNLGAIVVVSDGITTAGMNPVYALEGTQQPVISVLAGDTTLQKDIKVRDVIFNELAYLNTDVPLKAKIVNDGFETANLKVTLQQGEKVLDTKSLILSKNNPQAEVDFIFKPTQVGVQSFTISVSQLEGEITYRNNTRSFSINVLETRVKIAMFGGSPHPDLGALNEAMKHEQGWEVSEFILKGKGEYYNSPLSANLKDMDLLILHNFPNSPADAPVIQKILTEVKERKVPVIYFIGMFTDLNTLKPLYEYMALAPENVNFKSEEAVPNFSDKYKNHSSFTFGDNWLKLMSNTPPLFRNKSDWKAKATAEIFATAKIKNIPMSQYPIFALQSHLGRKNMTFVGENFWRMRMNAYTESENFDAFDDWYFNTIKWLMVEDDKRKFKVYTPRNLYTGNEPVILKGEAYDDSYNPISGVEMKASVKLPNGKTNDYFLKEAAGAQYFLEIYGLPQGNYTFTAVGKKNNAQIGTDEGKFSVGRSEIEHINLRADATTMQQMALRSGGKMISYKQISQLPELLNSLNLKTLTDTKIQKKPLLDWKWMLGAILALLCIEWIVRKWYSML